MEGVKGTGLASLIQTYYIIHSVLCYYYKFENNISRIFAEMYIIRHIIKDMGTET